MPYAWILNFVPWLRRPVLHRREEAVVHEFRERLSPVVADGRRRRPRIEDQGGEERPQVVAPARLERLEEVAGPVGLVDFEAVAEDRVRGRRVEGGEQAVADGAQVMIDRRTIVVIEDEALGPDGRPFHHHPAAAGDEEQHVACARRAVGQGEHAVADARDLAKALRGGRGRGRRQERRHQAFTRADVRHGRARRAGRDDGPLDPQLAGGLGNADLRPAVRPAAAECQVDAQPELARLGGRETDVVEEPVGEKRLCLESLIGIVEHDGVHRLDLEPADAAVLHEAHLALEAGPGHRRPEPPPAHHDPRIVGRREEQAFEGGETGRRALGRGERQGAGQDEDAGQVRPCAKSGVHDGEVV